MTSEFVRQELRAIVGARTQQQQQRVPNSLQNNLSGQVSQDDLDALGLTFEMSSAGRFLILFYLFRAKKKQKRTDNIFLFSRFLKKIIINY